MYHRRGSLAAAGTVAVLLLAGWACSGTGPTGTGGRSAALPLAGPSGVAPPLVYHSALYANATSPSGTTPPGEIIGASYRLLVPNYPSNAAPATVRIPPTLVELPTSTGGIRLYFSALNLTVNGSATVAGTPGPANRFTTPLTFNATSLAVLTTQGLAVLASWPVGAYSLQFRWQWVLEAPNGATTLGPWSNASTLTPAQTADLTFPGGPSWAVGTSRSLCVDGPVAGRTFSAHLSTSNPSAVYVTGTATVPPGQSGPYCWTNTLPAGPVPQEAFLHLWEYGNLTYELDVVGVPLLDPSTGGSAPTGSTWGWVVAIVAIGAAIVGFEVAYMLFPQVVGRVLPARLQHRLASPVPPPGAVPDLPPPPPPEAPDRTLN